MQLGKTILLPVLAATAAAGHPLAAADFSIPALEGPQRCNGVEGYAAAFGGRRTFLIDPAQVTAIKAVRDSDPAVRAAYRDLIVRADAALARQPGSVMDKTTIPLSNDRHDYLSLAPYWWPDPSNPSGAYVRRDGEMNPRRNTKSFDRTALGRMSGDTATLGLAYYYSDDPRYAAKAAALIRTWFLDPATRMNPNMNFAQAVPGRENGRAEGVLDTSAFMDVIDTVGLIAPSGALKAGEVAALERWFGDYVDWMRTSANGKGERAAANNHGIWYDAQLIDFALFARKPEVAASTLAAFPKVRIAAQFEPNGALLKEIARTRSFHYSLYALEPAYDVAMLGQCFGKDLWRYRDAKGRGLESATRFVASYRGRPEAWPHKELEWPAEELEALSARAASVWGRAAFPNTAGGDTVLRFRAADAR